MASLKIGIAASGGGMACAYGAGALLALAEVHCLQEPYIAVGSSGSTGSLAYYVAKQYAAGRKIWGELLSTSRFIDPFRIKNILNIDYLIDEVFKKQEPLNVEAVHTSTTRLLIAATDYETGEALYYDSKVDRDIYNALRGSKAAPIVFRGEPWFKGRRVIDGDLSSPLEKNVEKALAEGAEKVIAIDTRNSITALVHRLLTRYASQVSPALAEVVQKYLRSSRQPITHSKVLCLTPHKKVAISAMLDNKKEHLQQALEQGYKETAEHPQLPAFLGNG